ncbi:hypothetical protein TRICHSKD4_5669 [Roseibium sp. TrichSKD4]|nr:hypothetical protein TRICHSKD4_5669 [Roseibium sp. TrichSKD4]
MVSIGSCFGLSTALGNRIATALYCHLARGAKHRKTDQT